MIAFLLILAFGVCIAITIKQAIKPVPHTKDDPHGRGKHIDTYL
jgi:hypothetical protein